MVVRGGWLRGDERGGAAEAEREEDTGGLLLGKNKQEEAEVVNGCKRCKYNDAFPNRDGAGWEGGAREGGADGAGSEAAVVAEEGLVPRPEPAKAGLPLPARRAASGAAPASQRGACRVRSSAQRWAERKAE